MKRSPEKICINTIILALSVSFLSACSQKDADEPKLTPADSATETKSVIKADASASTKTNSTETSTQTTTAAMESDAAKVDTPDAEHATTPSEPEFAIDKSDPQWKVKLSQPEMMTFEAGKTYFWDMQTNKGNMSFRLYHKSAPMHATSTIFLSKIGFYDNVIFHRVIPGFMAQGGDPLGKGTGGPGYKYAGEFDGTTSHSKPGMLSMANAGPNTDGSQFFITFIATPFLDGKHTVFGELVSGDKTLQALQAHGSRSGATDEPLIIEKTSIRVE